jgi:hypothetical protein
LGLYSTAPLSLDRPGIKMVCLMTVAIWSLSRFAFFAFEGIANYLDPS